jgi:hypothetical protein
MRGSSVGREEGRERERKNVCKCEREREMERERMRRSWIGREGRGERERE